MPVNIPSIVDQSYHFLKDSILPTLSPIQKKVAIIALVLIATVAAVITAYYFAVKWALKSEYGGVAAVLPFSSVIEDVEEAPLEPQPEIVMPTEEERKEIKALKGEWLDDPEAEIKRLQAKGLISSQLESCASSLVHDTKGQEQFKFIVGRVQGLKKKYESTHYVFTHGQGKGLFVINALMKKLLKQFKSEFYNPLSLPFRLPLSVDFTENVNAFFKKYPDAASGSHSFNDDELNAKTAELLSVDTCMWSTASQESALYFFSKGTNINMSDPKIGEKIFKKIFEPYLQDDYLCKIVAKKAQNLAVEHAKANRLGTMWTICVPKAVVEDPKRNLAYRSHTFGRKCNCHSKGKDIPLLRQMQQEKMVSCKEGTPQYRLLTARLVLEPGVRTFAVSGLKKADNKAFGQKIKNLVRELAFYAKIVELTAPLSAEVAAPLIKEFEELRDLKQLDGECLEYLLTTKQDFLTDKLRDEMHATALAMPPPSGTLPS